MEKFIIAAILRDVLFNLKNTIKYSDANLFSSKHFYEDIDID